MCNIVLLYLTHCRLLLQIITAVINTWIWANYNKLFEKTFAKRGRIDVDPDCKWVIYAAIEVATRSLVGKTLKVNKLSNQKGQQSNTIQPNYVDLQVNIAILVSQALARGLRCNEEMVSQHNSNLLKNN